MRTATVASRRYADARQLVGSDGCRPNRRRASSASEGWRNATRRRRVASWTADPRDPGPRVRQGLFAHRNLQTAEASWVRMPRTSAQTSPAGSGRSQGFQASRPSFVNRIRASRPRTRVRIWFQDEARFGQQGTLTTVWTLKGSRPTVVRQHGRKSIWVFAAVEPAIGWSIAIPYREVNTETTQAFLNAAARRLRRREHAAMILDGAGRHCSGRISGQSAAPAGLRLRLKCDPYSIQRASYSERPRSRSIVQGHNFTKYNITQDPPQLAYPRRATWPRGRVGSPILRRTKIMGDSRRTARRGGLPTSERRRDRPSAWSPAASDSCRQGRGRPP